MPKTPPADWASIDPEIRRVIVERLESDADYFLHELARLPHDAFDRDAMAARAVGFEAAAAQLRSAAPLPAKVRPRRRRRAA